jgi:3-oxocholest-4-en-26-oyl-CoA dehydrogenase beta subunit
MRVNTVRRNMDIKLTEEQEMLKTMARDFLTAKYPKTMLKEIQASEKGYTAELWDEMAGLGWQGLVIPEKYGGNGMTFQDFSVLLEEIGRACLPGPFFATVLLGVYPLLDAGSDEQKQNYLPKIASGKAIFTMALTEADTQIAQGSIQTHAVTGSDGYILDGMKLFVPSANVADYIICAAATGSGISLFIVDGKAPGIKVTVLKTIDNEKLCEVVFTSVHVPKTNLLGTFNGGWPLVEKTVERAAIARCCDTVGGMQQVLDMTVQYAKDRKQFDQPIGKFQIIQHYLANAAIDVDGLKFVTYQAAWMKSEGMPCSKEASIAKAWASEASDRVLALAHQVHGAIGVTIDHDLQYYTKRLKAAAALFGDAEYHKEIVARQMGL